MDQTRPLIAVLDDETQFCKALARLLKSYNFEVVTYTHGEEFLKSCALRLPHCLLLDLHMPEINGFEVLDRIARKHLPVIVITGHDSPEARARAVAGGVSAYLRKPVDDQLLLDAIAVAISKKESAKNQPVKWPATEPEN